MDALELKLCDIQGRLFELFANTEYDVESLVKAFMNGEIAKNLDFSRRKSEGILTYFKLDNVEKADFCHLRRCSDTDATA